MSFDSLPGTTDPDLSAFAFDYRPLDDPEDGQRFTRYWDLEPLQRGPQPVPDWLVTDRAALETELGVLKTGKEADVFLVERAVPGTDGVVLAAKRYRSAEHRTFHRNAGYTEGRRTKDSREARAIAKKSAFGREAAAGQWAWAEWESLQRCYEAGIPVPYPVQIDGTEILMELVAVDGEAAPRLATTRPDRALLEDWFDQLRDAMAALALRGLAHGDLTPRSTGAAAALLVQGGFGGVVEPDDLTALVPGGVSDDLAALIPDDLVAFLRDQSGAVVQAAPRLAAMRPEPGLLADWFGQVRDALVTMAGLGLVHGDLSPYNVLAAGERLVLIDLPQMVDLVANPNGPEFLLRDCTNMVTWFRRRGLDVDEHALFGEVMAAAW